MPVRMSPVGEPFNFFGLNLVVDSVKYNGFCFTSLSDDMYRSRITIEAHKDVNATNSNPFGIDRVIFNGPATIVFWEDGTKTVVKCAEKETYNERTAIMWAIMKKTYGSSSRVNKVLDKLISDAESQEPNEKKSFGSKYFNFGKAFTK